MKVITIYGVPYHVNDKNEVFLYSSSQVPISPVQIGYLDDDKKLHIDPDWQTKSQEALSQYRSSLAQKTEEDLQKARVIQGII